MFENFPLILTKIEEIFSEVEIMSRGRLTQIKTRQNGIGEHSITFARFVKYKSLFRNVPERDTQYVYFLLHYIEMLPEHESMHYMIQIVTWLTTDSPMTIRLVGEVLHRRASKQIS
jgi:hypothetical protein